MWLGTLILPVFPMSICYYVSSVQVSYVHVMYLTGLFSYCPIIITPSQRCFSNSHSCPSITAAVSWCQRACPRQIMTQWVQPQIGCWSESGWQREVSWLRRSSRYCQHSLGMPISQLLYWVIGIMIGHALLWVGWRQGKNLPCQSKWPFVGYMLFDLGR